jgi:hypothetical protein
VVIRRNIIRHVDGASDPSGMIPGRGIVVSGCGDLVVEENVVDLDATAPIEYKLCGSVRFFNNQTAAGVLIQGVDVTNAQNPKNAGELPTNIEDAILLSF